MPPIENELAESDFDDAVITRLYVIEAERDTTRSAMQARSTAEMLARILAPALRLEIVETGDVEG